MKRFTSYVITGLLMSLPVISLASEAAAGADESSFGFMERAPWLRGKLRDFANYLLQKPSFLTAAEAGSEGTRAQFSHSWATNAYDAQGYSADPSVAMFGSSSWPLSRAFVASQLLVDGNAKVVKKVSDATPLAHTKRHYLALLGEQQRIAFKCVESRQQLELLYSRRFGNRFSLQVACPFERVERHLTLDPHAEIDRANREALVDATANTLVRSAMGEMRPGFDAPGFYESYSNMDNFVQQVLHNSGIDFANKQEEVGLGDIWMKGTLGYEIPYVDECQVSAKLSLNTAKAKRNVALAEPELGNGAHAVNVDGFFGWRRGVYANPYVRVGLGYNVPTQTSARVPYKLNYGGANHLGDRLLEAYPRTIPFSDVIVLGGAPFSEPESTIPGFASSLSKMTLRKGLSCAFEFGNRFEGCFGKPMHATIAYRYEAQQQHSITGLENAEQYAPGILTANTGRRSHDLLMSVGYRLSELCSIDGGITHRFAGRNSLKDTRVWGGLSLSF